MAEEGTVKVSPEGLKLIHDNLEKIGSEMNLQVDDEGKVIEAVDDHTDQIIRENIINKTNRILRPEERKRFLAIGQIFMDEWLSQIRAYKANEKKVGLLTGAISMLKEKIKGGVGKILHIFKWPKFEKKKIPADLAKLFLAVAAIGVGMKFFWKDIKKVIPKQIAENLEEIGDEMEKMFNLIGDELEKRYAPQLKKLQDETIKALHLDDVWADFVSVHDSLRNWAENPLDEFLIAMGVKDEPVGRSPIMRYSKKTVEEAKQIVQGNADSSPKTKWAEKILEEEAEADRKEAELIKLINEKKAELKKQLEDALRVTQGMAWNVILESKRGRKYKFSTIETTLKSTNSVSGIRVPMMGSGENADISHLTMQWVVVWKYLQEVQDLLTYFFQENGVIYGLVSSEINSQVRDKHEKRENPNGHYGQGKNRYELERIENKFGIPNTVGKIRNIFIHYKPGMKIPRIDELQIERMEQGRGWKGSVETEKGTVTFANTYDQTDYSVRRIRNKFKSRRIDRFEITVHAPDTVSINENFRIVEQTELKQIQELRKHNQYLSGILMKMDDAVNKMNKVVPA